MLKNILNHRLKNWQFDCLIKIWTLATYRLTHHTLMQTYQPQSAMATKVFAHGQSSHRVKCNDHTIGI